MTTTLQRSAAATNLAAIKSLRSDNPDPDIMKQFKGWGCCANVLVQNPDLTDETPEAVASREIVKYLDSDEISEAKASILNAFYTPPWVIKVMWEMLGHLGFDGGTILEPSCGTLRFLEHQPKAMRENSRWYAVEADPIPAAIARLCYPEATVYNRKFEDCDIPEDGFDVVIGNFPFGQYSPVDTRYNQDNYFVHSYFMYKSIHLARAGGLVCVITGQGTLDSSRDKKLRKFMAQNGKLLLSVRLPYDTHEGAGASCDILIYQKKGKGEFTPGNVDWLENHPAFPEDQEIAENMKLSELTKLKETGKIPIINKYYVNHPDHLLGDLKLSTRFDGRTYVEARDGQDTVQTCRELYKRLQKNQYQAIEGPATVVLPDEYQDLPKGAFVEHDDAIMQRLLSKLVKVPKKHWPRIRKALELLAHFDILLEFERTSDDDDRAGELRERMQDCYYDFIFKFGTLRSNLDLLGADPRMLNLMNLEIDQPGGVVQSEFFHRRTVRPLPKIGKTDNPADALAQCLNRYGRLRPKFIGELLDKDPSEAMATLAAEGLVFFDPIEQDWVDRDRYLSGDVKTKLEQALTAGLERNATELRNVLPTPVLPPASTEIQMECAIALEIPINTYSEEARQKLFTDTLAVQLGAIWVPGETYAEFVAHLMTTDEYRVEPTAIRIEHISVPYSQWSCNYDMKVNLSPQNKNKWGTPSMAGLDIFEHALRKKPPKITKSILVDGSWKEVIDEEKTEAAQAKVEEIRSEFDSWLWQDQRRAVNLAVHYNETVNRYRHRDYDGDHLTFPGSNPDKTMRPHQKNAVWRLLQRTEGEGSLLGHSVGAGKTFVMAAFCMEARRLGLASKPLIAAMNDTVGGIVKDIFDLYPEAKVLYPQGNDMKSKGRQLFLNRIATEDFDIAVIPHSMIKDVPMSKGITKDYLDKEMEELELLMTKGFTDYSKSVQRSLQTKKRNLEEKILEVVNLDQRNQGLTWEQMGVDLFCLDESQVAKKLPFHTDQEVAGLDNGRSGIGMDVKMKADYILRQRKGYVVFSTGTPVTNTMAELFNLMRFLIEPRLKALRINSFDAWASMFAEVQTASEVSPEGTFQVRTRFARFTNLPELMELYWSFADLVSAEELGLDRPTPIFVEEVAEASDDLVNYMEFLRQRAVAIRNRQVDPEDDIILNVVGDGRASAADIRLVQANGEDSPESKLNRAVWCMWKIWQATSDVKGTQFIFSDIGSPKKDAFFDIYREIEQKLIALGVPDNQIAFVHDARNNEQRKILFDRVNRGKIRFLLGGTKKGGTGVNVQKRLVALHHFEPDWRPSDIEQREGRIIRQGNLFKRVLVFRHITAGIRGLAGFDAFFWQKLKQKATFIEQINQRKLTQRHSEDIGKVAMGYNALMSIASGDPMLKEEADLMAELKKHELRAAGHSSQQLSISFRLREAVDEVDRAAEKEELLQNDLATLQHDFDGIIQIGKKRYQDWTKIGAAINKERKAALSVAHMIKIGFLPNIKWEIHLTAFSNQVHGIITPDIHNKGRRYYFEVNGSNPTMTGFNLRTCIEQQVQICLNDHQRTVKKAKQEMKELSNIRQTPYEALDRMKEIRERLKVIAKEKKAIEEQMRKEAEEKAKAGTTKRIETGRALLLPPHPEVIEALRNLDYHPDWLDLLPELCEEMRQNEAAKAREQAERDAAKAGKEVVETPQDSGHDDEALALLTQRKPAMTSTAMQDTLF